jgi:HD-GYP domain-containing protein (c-di-GMP phosphodiesterase class II)
MAKSVRGVRIVSLTFDKDLYTQKISTASLRAGDILSHDVYLRQGTLVVKAGTELTESNIKSLKQMGDRVVTLDQRKLYKRGIAISKNLMAKAAENKPVFKEEVNELISPFIIEVQREKNILNLLEKLQSKDDYTFQHTVNIGILAYIIGAWYGLKGEELHRLAIVGTLHDIGKSKIPLTILNKPGPLTEEEYLIMKQHAVLGYEILNLSPDYEEEVKLAVLQHHERENGTGYPNNLRGGEISLYARIVAVADTFHAMTTDRVYRRKINPYAVLEHLKRNRANLNVEIIHLVVDRMLNYLQGCKVTLSNGTTGDIVYIDKEDLAYPLVMLANSQLVDLRRNKDISILEIFYE